MKPLLATTLVSLTCSLSSAEPSSDQTPIKRDRFSLSGDFLYWKSDQKGLAYRTEAEWVITTVDYSKEDLVMPDFSWEPGYRLTADYTFTDAGWKVGAQGTRYTGFAHGSFSPVIEEGVFPTFSFDNTILPTDYADSAKARWRLHTSMIDVFGQYEWKINSYFSLSPNIAIRNAWIEQRVLASYEGGTFSAGIDRVRMKSHFYGVGPRIGLEPRVFCGKGFSLYASGAGTALYGWFHTRQKETFLSVTTESLRSSVRGVRWVADAFAGVTWAYDAKPTAAIKSYVIDAGFDFLYFSKQYAFKDGPRFSLPSQSSYLILYGFHLSAGLQF